MSSQNENIVLEKYEERAERVISQGYRKAPWYLAQKLLCDWYLLTDLPLSGMRVLNLGCAEPIDEIFYAAQVKEWVAVDLSPKSIEVAEKILKMELSPQLCEKVKFQVADMTALPFPEESFDLVVSFSTVEHIPERAKRQKAIAEMARVCKPGGWVAVTVPNILNLNFYLWHINATRKGQTDYGYAHLYTPWELRGQLKKAGLKLVRFGSEIKNLSFSWIFIPFYKLLSYLGGRMGYLCRKV